MDDATLDAIKALGIATDELAEDVEAAFEEHSTFQNRLDTRVRVEAMVLRFRELYLPLNDMDQVTVDRTVGRKVRDLQKVAAKLPTPPQGKPAEKKSENQFWETREGKSSRKPIQPGENGVLRAPDSGVRVADEVEAWCGGCIGLKTHVVSAVVGGVPAQVVCTVCRKSHKFRADVPEKRRAELGLTPKTAGTVTALKMPGQDKASKEKQALIAAIQAAADVRDYSPRERYKAGEIVSHPEWGRGRIENILPRSMMVRFTAGLRSLKLG